MKRIFNAFFAVLLCALLLVGTVAIGGEGLMDVLKTFTVKADAAKITDFNTGDIIEFGWYPQSKETDSTIISALNELGGDNADWTSYNYYSGNDSSGGGTKLDGQMKSSNYMRYKDIMYGTTKYRGVYFDSYRPNYTGQISSDSRSWQYSNGYRTGTTYWFKYEPLKWRVLDPKKGVVMSNLAIDSQAFNNYVWYGVGSKSVSSQYYGDEAHTFYASDYSRSSIRKWLNEEFYNCAFSQPQQSTITATQLENNSSYSSEYDSISTFDKIYLLSYDDITNSNYGFNQSYSANDYSRQIKCSDYASCQGCCEHNYGDYIDNCFWWLRTPNKSNYSEGVYWSGNIGYDTHVNNIDNGVVPILNISLASDIFQSSVSETGIGNGSGCGEAGVIDTKIPFFVKDTRNVFVSTDWYWDDLTQDNSAYNQRLAINSLLLSKAAETSQSRVENILKNYYGFSRVLSYDYKSDDLFSPGITFGLKEYAGNIIVAVVVRGSTSAGDVATDVLSQVIISDGFLLTYDSKCVDLKKYIEGYYCGPGVSVDYSKVKVLITGHSYGAAVAQGMAMSLPNKGISSDNIYAYTFASPNVLAMENGTSNPGLFNIVNNNDLVPKVPIGMYGKFGRTYTFDSKESKYDTALSTVWGEYEQKEHSLSTYLSYLLTESPDGSANSYSVQSVSSATSFSNATQSYRSNDPLTQLTYSKLFLNNAGIPLYDACVPGLLEGYTPQGLTYDSVHNWILISAYDSTKNNASAIFALDADTGKFVAQFNIYIDEAKLTPSKIHAGGIAATKYNLYLTYTDSNIAYIPLSDLTVSNGTVKNLSISGAKDLGKLLNDTGTAYLNYEDGILWTGNFYCTTPEAILAKKDGDWDIPASNDANTVVLGYGLSGKSSSEEWTSFGNIINDYDYTYKINIPNSIDGVQGVTVNDETIYLSRAEWRPYCGNQHILFHSVELKKNSKGKHYVCNLDNKDWGKVVNLAGGENIYFRDGYMYSIYEASSYVERDDITDKILWHSKSLTDTIWKTKVSDMKKGIKLGKVNCPVDVEIINKATGDVVGRIANNEVDYSILQSETGVIMEVNGDEKIFYLPSNGDYEVKLTGNDNGTMDYSLSTFNEDAEIAERINFFDVSLNAGTEYTSEISGETITDDVLVKSDSSVINPNKTTVDNVSVTVSVSGEGTATESFECVLGDRIEVTATPSIGNIFMGWYIGNELISSEADYSFVAKEDTNLIARFKKINVSITNCQNITVDFKSSVTLHAQCDVDGTSIAWFNANTNQKLKDGNEYKIDTITESVSVYAAATENGSKIDGTESKTETISVRTGFFDKLIAFFRGLFKSLPVYIDNNKQ